MKSADELIAAARAAWEKNDHARARSLLERARRLAPRRSDLAVILSKIELGAGNALRAVALCRQALAMAPESAPLWKVLAEALQHTDPNAAEEAWTHAANTDPQNPEAWFHLGNARAGRADLTGAIAAYENVLRIMPGHAQTLANLGLALDRNGDAAGAEARYRQALAVTPHSPEPLANLAYLFFRRGRFADALACYDALVARIGEAPADVWNNRGVCARHEALNEVALESFRHALAARPDSPEVLANLGFLECEARMLDSARTHLERAHALAPTRLQIAAQLLELDLHVARWLDFAARREELVRGVAALCPASRQVVSPFVFMALDDDPALQQAAARSFAWVPDSDASTRAAPSAALLVAGTKAAPTAVSRVRIGFVTSSFRAHPVPRLLIGLLERLDRRRFEVHAISLSAGMEDAFERRVKNAVDAYHDGSTLASSALMRRLREAHYAVLFDLDGHTRGARPQLFAARLAAMQVNFLGYAGTLGSRAYDIIVADRVVIPDQAMGYYDEAIVRLDGCYIPSDPTRSAGPIPGRERYGLGDDARVLLAPSALYKITPDMFDLWMQILGQIATGVLWLRDMPTEVRARLREEAERRGVAGSRLVFAPEEDVDAYLARLPLADLVLDTFPFGAHTSVNDALWAGVPVVTRTGRSMASRASASQLCATGQEGLVAATANDYVAIATALANTPTATAARRAELAAARATSTLFDMERYARRFEAMLEAIAAPR